MKKYTIGVLDFQGLVEAHRNHIEHLGAYFKKVKSVQDCKGVDAYILPGGESSSMIKVMKNLELLDFFQSELRSRPTWGICAGAILMAQDIKGKKQFSFSLLEIEVERNAYGTQRDSFLHHIDDYPICFIRAPKIIKAKGDVLVHQSLNTHPVWVSKGHHMATTFHPELTKVYPSPMHSAFLDMVQRCQEC